MNETDIQQVVCDSGTCLDNNFRVYSSRERLVVICSTCGAVKLERRRTYLAMSEAARAREQKTTPEQRSARARLGALAKAAKIQEARKMNGSTDATME
jgi:hypothetical protein